MSQGVVDEQEKTFQTLKSYRNVTAPAAGSSRLRTLHA